MLIEELSKEQNDFLIKDHNFEIVNPLNINWNIYLNLAKDGFHFYICKKCNVKIEISPSIFKHIKNKLPYRVYDLIYNVDYTNDGKSFTDYIKLTCNDFIIKSIIE